MVRRDLHGREKQRGTRDKEDLETELDKPDFARKRNTMGIPGITMTIQDLGAEKPGY